jgi:anti-anti-sigma regulatory factor
VIVPGDFSWQSYHSFWIVTPENDPERAIRWSPPNIDYGGKGLICCVSIPVYKGDEFIGVWTIDVPLSVLLRDTLIHAPIPGQDNFLVSVDGELVAHRTIETVIEKGGGSVYHERIDVLGGDYASLDLRSLAAAGEGTLEVRDADGRPQLVCYSAVAPTRWILFNAFPMEQVTEARARTLREALDRIQRGDLSFRIERANIDEMAALVDGYNAMAASLERMRSEQEEAIRSLSSPIIEVGDGILAVPIVGAVDEARAADTMARLLAEIVRVRARAVALDFTGVTRGETIPAEALARIARAVELLGAHCVISGLAPDLARKLAGRSADMGGVRCYGTLKTALAAMMDAGRRRY